MSSTFSRSSTLFRVVLYWFSTQATVECVGFCVHVLGVGGGGWGGGQGEGDVFGRVNVSVGSLYTGCGGRRGWGRNGTRDPNKIIFKVYFCLVCFK